MNLPSLIHQTVVFECHIEPARAGPPSHTDERGHVGVAEASAEAESHLSRRDVESYRQASLGATGEEGQEDSGQPLTGKIRWRKELQFLPGLSDGELEDRVTKKPCGAGPDVIQKPSVILNYGGNQGETP